MTRDLEDRRQFLLRAAGAGAALVVLGPASVAEAKSKRKAEQGGEKEEKEGEEEVSPTEDLMREHGVLRRILLVYGEVIRRVEANQPFAPDVVARSAQIIRAFIEDYHEKDEETYIFPRFHKAGKMTGLVDVLLQQHQAGRRVTADIQRLATAAALGSASNRQKLAHSMRLFIRMYEPHAAREDTVLFPAFAELVGKKELHELMETFEQKEKALPMGDFEKMVADVSKLEQALGIYDLAQFTPKA
jgi:hemerythrin-like domain-containing protein